MPVAAFVDRKKDEEEKAQAEQAKQAADIAEAEAKAEAERSLKEWLLEVLHDPRAIVKFIKRYRLAANALAVAVSMMLAFYLVVLPLYYSYLFNAGERALENREYNDSIDYMNSYLSANSNDAEAILLLAQAHLLSKRFSEAERILADAEGNAKIIQKIEFWYYRAGLHLLAEPKKPNPYINKSLDIAPEHVPTLLVRGLGSIAKRNWQEAQSDFERLLLIVEGSDYSKEDVKTDIDFWMNYYFENQLLPAISFMPGLSFSELLGKPPIADNLGFDIDPSGFQNLYYVPYDLGFLVDMDIPGAVSFLLLVAYIIDDKELEAKSILNNTSGGKSVWGKYYHAYLDIKTGDYAAAAKQYNEIIAEKPSSDSLVMFANALWANSQGGRPTKELLALYDAAHDADKKNILSTNNLAFMKIYTGDEDEALSLLREAVAEGENNSYIAINIALLDLSLGNFKAARPIIYALLETTPESLLLLNAALLIERELGNYQPAINIANIIKKLLPDSERIYLDIASIYKQGDNYLLELAELEKGYEEYPLSTDIVAELALSYIQNRQYKKAKKVLQYVVINIGDDYRVLWAQGKLNARTDAKAAGDFFREAVEKSPLSRKADVVFSLGRFYLNIEKKPESALEASVLAKGYNGRQIFSLLALRLRANAVLNINSVSEEEVRQAMLIMAEENVSVAAQIDIAWVLFLRGEIDRAISVLEELASGQVLSLEVLNFLNIAYLKKGATDEAETTRNRIAAIEGNDAKSDAELVKSQEVTKNKNIFIDSRSNKLLTEINQLVYKGDYPQAIALYTDLLEKKTRMRSPASTYQNRGVLYIKVKKYDLAVADFAKAVEIGGLTDEELQSVRYNYAYALIQVEKFNESVEQMEKLLALEPADEIKYLKLLGIAYSKATRVDDALRVYESLIKKEPNYVKAYFSVATIYNRFYNDPEKSIKTLLLLSSLQPSNASVYYGLGNYYTIIGELEKAENNFNLYKQYKDKEG